VPKFVPLYGEVSSIPANGFKAIIEYKVPTGYVAELFAIGVIPDYDPSTGASNLDGIYVAHATDIGGVGSAIPHSNLSANHNGKNAAPYGGKTSKQPIFIIDRPLMAGNLTYKFATGRVIQIIGKAGSSDTGKVRARAFVYLLDENDVRAIYGVGLNEFASLAGGHNQEKPVLPYFEYYDNENDTGGNGSWEKLKQIKIEDYEEVQLKEIGVAPHDNVLQLRLYDDRLNKYFPDRDPYYFRITPEENMLPFGDDDDYQGRLPLPDDIASHIWTHTSLDIEIKDNNAVVPAGGVRVQLIGVYRSTR